MTELSWFSACFRRVCLVENRRTNTYNDSVLVFTASDFEDAMHRAIQLGRGMEEEYLNDSGMRVRWRLKEIMTLDVIQADSLDGAEVYSAFSDVPEGEDIPFDAVFHPEDSEPGQTI